MSLWTGAKKLMKAKLAYSEKAMNRVRPVDPCSIPLCAYGFPLSPTCRPCEFLAMCLT